MVAVKQIQAYAAKVVREFRPERSVLFDMDKLLRCLSGGVSAET